MAVYQNSTANLGVKLEITHASPDIANNRTTITYKASVYKTGSHNPWNALSQTPMYLTINGQSLHSTATGNYDLRSGTYEQVIKTGTLVVPHDADGSKSFTFSWNVNFTSTGYGYGNVTTSGTYVLPNIARASTFTIPSTTITTGSAFTVTIARASGSFTHKVSYIVGNSEVVWTSSAATSYAATVPHSLFNSHKSTASVSGVIRVTTMNGSVEVGSNQRAVTINLDSTAIPTVGSLSSSNSNKSVFNSAGQFIRGISRLTATAGSVSGSYSSTIASYEFRVVRADSSTVFGTTSKTTSSHQFSAFDFPNSGSEVVTPQVRVRDSRGRYSAWRAASGIRVHYYAPPAIGTMTVRRTGSGNTTLQVTRNYSITLLYEGGAGSNLNTASLRFQHRTKGTTTATDNAGAKSTTTSLSNSNANLSGTFSASTSYEVRAVLNDAVAGQVIGSWISVGTEFVPMDIGPKGIGAGKVHSDGTADLEVGSGGIISEGTIRGNGTVVAEGLFQANVTANLMGMTRVHSNGMYNTLGMGGLYLASSSNVGTIVLTMPSGHNGMFSATVNIRSYNYSASLEVSGYTYTSSTTGWHSDKSFGNIVGGNLNVRFRHNGGNGRYISIGETTTDWGGYLQVTVENVKSGHGGAFGGRIGVALQTSWPGNAANNTYYLRPLFNTANDGSGSGLDADLLDGLHASSFMRSSVSVPTITSGTNDNGNWYNINGVLLICWYRFSISGRLTASQMNGTWTYPMPFAFAPAVSIGSRADGDPNSTNGYRRAGSTAFHQYNESATKTDILYAVNNGDVPASPQKFLNIFAMGTPA